MQKSLSSSSAIKTNSNAEANLLFALSSSKRRVSYKPPENKGACKDLFSAIDKIAKEYA